MSYKDKNLWERSAAELSVPKKEFDVTITETLRKTVTVAADSLLEAERLVSDNWHAGEHILDADDFVDVEFVGKDIVRDFTPKMNMPKYNLIVKCNLETDGTISHRDCFLLTGGKDVDESLEVELTGVFCFNTEFNVVNREFVCAVKTVDDVLAFCEKHNISVPSTCLTLKDHLRVGACCDYVLDSNLSALGWEEDLSDMFTKTPLEEQINKANPVFVDNKKPDCALIGQDGNIFNLMAIASKTLKKNGMTERATEMCDRIQKSGSYDEALCIIGEYVNITSEDKMNERGSVPREANEL